MANHPQSSTQTRRSESTLTTMTKPPRIIGLSGHIGSGKTWLSKRLHELYGFAPLSFASSLKDDLQQMGFSYYDLHVDKPEPVRRLMQVYGQARRFQDPMYWVTRGMAQAQHMMRLVDGVVVVFDDVRFPNEANAIRDAGGVIVRLACVEDVPEGFLVDVFRDESETSLDVYDFDARLSAARGEPDDLLDQMNVLLRRWEIV